MHPLQHLLSPSDAPKSNRFIGVDLDGTLAHYEEGYCDRNFIGKPIDKMMQRVRRWVADGKTVKIFTARAKGPAEITAIKQWLAEQGLGNLEVTNVKQPGMIEFWDDKAIAVKKNTGEIV